MGGLLIPGGLILTLFLMAAGGKKKKNETKNTSLPNDPLDNPIVVTSPPTTTTAPDVKKAVDILAKSAPGTPVKVTEEIAPRKKVVDDTKPNATKVFSPKTLETQTDDDGSAWNIESNTPFGVRVQPEKLDKSILDSSLLPKPTNKPPRIANIVNLDQCLNYALNGFHTIVNIFKKSGKVGSLPEAAASYYDAAVAIQDFRRLSDGRTDHTQKAIGLLRNSNSIADRVLKAEKIV